MNDAYIVNEHMDCREIVRERAKAGRGTLSACMVMEMQSECGGGEGQNLVKLLEALVGSVLMHGAEVWGCCRQLDGIEQIQLRACRIFLFRGVGRLHPRHL